jgi:glycosyltransferase involved in cell wall biosynthesis
LPYEQIVPHLEGAAVCVIPSLFDNFPYTCLEAMSFGKAIVSSDQGGMVEMLEGGRCGRLFTPPHSSLLAEHIVNLLRKPELALELGQKAQQRFAENYQTDTVLEQTLNYYYRSLNELSVY